MFQILKERKQLCWIAFLFFFTLPLKAFSFPILHVLPKTDLIKPKSQEVAPYIENRPLSEVWDTAREHEEAFSFFRKIPAQTSEKAGQDLYLVVFPKVTSGILSIGPQGKGKVIFGKEGHRYPPLVSYEGDELTVFQLLQAGHRACELKMTVQHGEILTAKESAGCVDYESQGHLLSKALIGAKMLPPAKSPPVKKAGEE